MRFDIVPLPLDEANAFVSQHHRHHGRVVGHKFSIGIATQDEHGAVEIRGVAIVSRPVARRLAVDVPSAQRARGERHVAASDHRAGDREDPIADVLRSFSAGVNGPWHRAG